MNTDKPIYPKSAATERMVTLIGPDGPQQARLSWERLGVGRFRLTLDGPGDPIEAIDRDYFDALAAIRRQLEPLGWSIAIQGARRDTYPSGMLRDNGARFVYVLKMGEQLTREEMPRTFDDADPAELGTVAEQAEYYHRWRESVFG